VPGVADLWPLWLTLGIELALAVPVARRWLGVGPGRLALDVTLLNLFTWPLATLAVEARVLPWATAEALVAAVEAVGYRRLTGLSTRRAIALSVVANGVSGAASFLV